MRQCEDCGYRWDPLAPADGPPFTFAVFAGTFTSRAQRLHWHDGALIYEDFGAELERRERLTLEPASSDWAPVWELFDRLGVWSWEEEYALPGGATSDPVQWSVEAGHGARWVHTSGEDAFPPDGDGPAPHPVFLELCAALSALAGGLAFGPAA